MHTRRTTRVLVVLIAFAAIGIAAGSAWAYHQACGLDQGTDVGTGSSGGDTYICYSIGNPGATTTPCGAQTICGNVHAGPRPTDTGTSGFAFDICVEPGACVGRTGVQTAGLIGTTSVGKTGILVANIPVGTNARTGAEHVPASPIIGLNSTTCAIVACVPGYVNAGKVRVYANNNSGTTSPPICVSYTVSCPP